MVLEFNTERLTLRQWRDEDRGPFAAMNADPVVMEFFPATLSGEQSDEAADRCERMIQERGWGFWAVEESSSKEFVGCIGLSIPSPDLPCSPCVEVGWRLSHQYWGKGYATEAARESLRMGFEKLDFTEIVSFTTIGNVRSRHVMEKLGMTESLDTFDHPAVPVESGLREHCLYRLSREVWSANV